MRNRANLPALEGEGIPSQTVSIFWTECLEGKGRSLFVFFPLFSGSAAQVLLQDSALFTIFHPASGVQFEKFNSRLRKSDTVQLGSPQHVNRGFAGKSKNPCSEN